MTRRQTARWKILVNTFVGSGGLWVCASPTATNKDLIAYCDAILPSRAMHRGWTVKRSGPCRPAPCETTRGFQHYLLTYTEEIV